MEMKQEKEIFSWLREMNKMENRTDIENKRESCEEETISLVRTFVEKGLTLEEVRAKLEKVAKMNMTQLGMQINNVEALL